jgi:hypothetical protein
MRSASSTRIAALLTKIARGELTDMQALARLLIQDGHHFNLLRSLVQYSPSLTRPQHAQIINMDGFDRLRQKYRITEPGDRVSAALSGDSHRVGVSGCFAVMSSSLLNTPPLVCEVHEDVAHLSRPFGTTLVVVENEELMVQKEQLVAFLEKHCKLPPSADTDLLLGAGNRAASAHYAAIYRHYRQVWFLPDLDVGGAVIFQNALRIAPDGVVLRLLIPDNADEMLCTKALRDRPGDGLTSEQKEQLRSLAIHHIDLSKLAHLLLTHGTQIEQEVYLAQ